GLWAQQVVVESGGGLRAPGDSVLLSCRAFGLNFGISSVRWYRQVPGGSVEWVSVISSQSTAIQFGSAVDGRATASRDNSRSEASLELRALTPRDSACYFCTIHTE
ncbi:HV01 protein, partial [Chordeiles acutipennis]|nr:HV01 protein [Chordeiles acutipennis]